MNAAIATLQAALDVLKNNEPVFRQEGNIEQADDCLRQMAEIEKFLHDTQNKCFSSLHAIGDTVGVKFSPTGYVVGHALVESVRFTQLGKVLYSLQPLVSMAYGQVWPMDDVDSVLVVKL